MQHIVAVDMASYLSPSLLINKINSYSHFHWPLISIFFMQLHSNIEQKWAIGGSRVKWLKKSMIPLSCCASTELGKAKLICSWICQGMWRTTGKYSTSIRKVKGKCESSAEWNRETGDNCHREGWGYWCLLCLSLCQYNLLLGILDHWDQRDLEQGRLTLWRWAGIGRK